MKRAVAVIAVVLALGLGAAACSSTSNEAMTRSLAPLPQPPSATVNSPVTTAPATCTNPRESFAPDGNAAGPTISDIQSRGMLVVGVDQGTAGWGNRDPRDGQLTGLEVDLLQDIASAMFGGDPLAHLKFKTVTTAQRIAAVKSGKVDMVASLLTATCERWEEVNFSSVYYNAKQSVLVNKDSDIEAVSDLADRTVCATRGSTSIVEIAKVVPTAKVYPVDTRSDCMVALQEGRVDAITSDDTILRSFQAQEPIVHTRTLEPLAHVEEPYAIAIQQGHEDLVRFVNGVLEQMREDGRLEALYVRWLDQDAPAAPPPAEYGR